MKEHDIQSAAIEILKLSPAFEWIHAVPNGGARNAIVGKRLKYEGVTPGIWDLDLPVVVYRSDVGTFAGLKIEVKAGKNKLTEEQARYGIFCHDQGYAIAVCRTVNEICDTCYKYLKGLHDNGPALTECNNVLEKPKMQAVRLGMRINKRDQ